MIINAISIVADVIRARLGPKNWWLMFSPMGDARLFSSGLNGTEESKSQKAGSIRVEATDAVSFQEPLREINRPM